MQTCLSRLFLVSILLIALIGQQEAGIIARIAYQAETAVLENVRLRSPAQHRRTVRQVILQGPSAADLQAEQNAIDTLRQIDHFDKRKGMDQKEPGAPDQDALYGLEGLPGFNPGRSRVIISRLPKQDEFKIKRILTAPIDSNWEEDDLNRYISYGGKRRKRETQSLNALLLTNYRDTEYELQRRQRPEDRPLRRQRRYGRIIKALIPKSQVDDDDDDDDDYGEEEEVVEELDYVEQVPDDSFMIENQPMPMPGRQPYIKYVPVPTPPKRKKKPQQFQVQLQLPPELMEAMHEAKRQREKPRQTVQIIEVERKMPEAPTTTTPAPTPAPAAAAPAAAAPEAAAAAAPPPPGPPKKVSLTG